MTEDEREAFERFLKQEERDRVRKVAKYPIGIYHPAMHAILGRHPGRFPVRLQCGNAEVVFRRPEEANDVQLRLWKDEAYFRTGFQNSCFALYPMDPEK